MQNHKALVTNFWWAVMVNIFCAYRCHWIVRLALIDSWWIKKIWTSVTSFDVQSFDTLGLSGGVVGTGVRGDSFSAHSELLFLSSSFSHSSHFLLCKWHCGKTAADQGPYYNYARYRKAVVSSAVYLQWDASSAMLITSRPGCILSGHGSPRSWARTPDILRYSGRLHVVEYSSHLCVAQF